MTIFLNSRATKFNCIFASFLILTLNLPNLIFACWTVPGPGCDPCCPDDGGGGGGGAGAGAGCGGSGGGGGNHIIEPTGNLFFQDISSVHPRS